MTATERIRAMLDERGVEWSTNETLTDCWTRWDAGKLRCTATEINGIFAFSVGNSTPEQAIEATLGRGECRNTGNYISAFECDTCGGVYEMYREPSFCPSCGRKVRA